MALNLAVWSVFALALSYIALKSPWEWLLKWRHVITVPYQWVTEACVPWPVTILSLSLPGPVGSTMSRHACYCRHRLKNKLFHTFLFFFKRQPFASHDPLSLSVVGPDKKESTIGLNPFSVSSASFGLQLKFLATGWGDYSFLWNVFPKTGRITVLWRDHRGT